VRRTLQSLLRSLFDRAQDDALRPHAHILLLFTASALTHIFPEIRVDAIRVLDVFLQHIPEVVTAGWDSSSVERNADGPGRKLLQGYLGLLNLTRNDSSSSDGMFTFRWTFERPLTQEMQSTFQR
jgi:pre-rRNA-processing protein IPI1